MVFFSNLPLIQKKRTVSSTTVIKNILYEDIYKATNKEEANQMLTDEFASEELVNHIEKRFG